MTAAAFDQSVTDEINRRMDVCPTCGGTGGVDSGGVTPSGSSIEIPCPSCNSDEQRNRDLAPHIAKIPLRAEVCDLLHAAEIYDEQAARHAGEAAKCAELARCAREQAANLKLMGDL